MSENEVTNSAVSGAIARPQPAFGCELVHDDNGVRLVLSGELDIASAPELERRIGEAGASALVIDLGGLTFVDSTGLRLLLSVCAPDARPAPAELIPGPPTVQRVFELAGVAERLRFREVEDA